jgi:hypothetical protein
VSFNFTNKLICAESSRVDREGPALAGRIEGCGTVRSVSQRRGAVHAC